MKQILIAAALVAISGSAAFAGGQAGSIGVGVESSINGETGGVSANYDAGKFHLGGFFGYVDGQGANNTDFSLGGRFYYHVHSTAMTDFGLGIGVSLASVDGQGPMNQDRRLDVFIEPSAQIRLFLASNVALSFTFGIVVATADRDGFAFGGQGVGQNQTDITPAAPTALAGVHYYFF